MSQDNYSLYWYRIDMIPKCEQELFKRICDQLLDLIEEQWHLLHNYQNAMRSLLGDDYERRKGDVMETIAKEDENYQCLIQKLVCIDTKFKTQQFIPKNFIRHEFLQIAKMFFAPFYDWIDATVDIVFKSKYEYTSMWTDQYRTNVVFTNVVNKEDTIYMSHDKYLRCGVDTTPLIF